MIIKKLNSVFHRHSRWLFGLFTIVIIVSFIGFMVPGSFFGFGPDTGSGARVRPVSIPYYHRRYGSWPNGYG